MSDFSFIPSTSVVIIPSAHASAAFTAKTSEVFKEEHNIAPIIINDKMKYIPCGCDNQMPYNIIDLIESDETMSTCQMFNAEVWSAMAADLSMTRSLPPPKYRHKLLTLCWTTTSQVTSSVCARTSSIIDIVNSIRLAKGKVFAEWKKSETAKLFEDHGYKNKKQAGGYFF